MRHLICLCVCVLWVPLAFADQLLGHVIGIADGDTITVLIEGQTQEKIRLAGIDAPESKQAFGAVSRVSLSHLTIGKSVTIEWHKRDKYGRLIGKVLVNGLDANLEQIKRGLAWHYKDYEAEQAPADGLAYAAAEIAAREAKSGIWHDAEPIPPWVWRKMKRDMNAKPAAERVGASDTAASASHADQVVPPEGAIAEMK